MKIFDLSKYPVDEPAENLKKRITQNAKILKKDLSVKHSGALHIIAKQNDFKDWPQMSEFINHTYRGKWIEAFDTLCTGWDCVKNNDDEPALFDTEKEVQDDIDYDVKHGYCEEGDYFVIKGEDYIEGRKAIFTGEKS